MTFNNVKRWNRIGSKKFLYEHETLRNEKILKFSLYVLLKPNDWYLQVQFQIHVIIYVKNWKMTQATNQRSELSCSVQADFAAFCKGVQLRKKWPTNLSMWQESG